MKFLWMVVVVFSLTACGSGKAPIQTQYARFVGNTGEQLQVDKGNFEAHQSVLSALASDPSISIVLQIFGLVDHVLEVDWDKACLIDVVTMDGNTINSQIHNVSAQCDCLNVVPSEAAQCVGNVLAEDVRPVFVKGAVQDTVGFFEELSSTFSNICPIVDGVEDIPFIPPNCLGGIAPPSEIPNLSVSFAADFFGEQTSSLEHFSFNGIKPSSVAPYLTANGEQAQVFTYKNVDNKYDDCFLDAQLALGFDEAGNIVPASKLLEASPIYRVADHYLVSVVSKTCSYTVEAGTSDNANSEGIDNALSPYAGLDATFTDDFGVLEEGVLSLDYSNRFYKVSP